MDHKIVSIVLMVKWNDSWVAEDVTNLLTEELVSELDVYKVEMEDHRAEMDSDAKESGEDSEYYYCPEGFLKIKSKSEDDFKITDINIQATWDDGKKENLFDSLPEYLEEMVSESLHQIEKNRSKLKIKPGK